MRCVVYTEDNFLELGITAKTTFLNCLPPDDKGQYDVVQIMSQDIKNKINKLTDDDFGMAWQKKFSYIEKVKKVINKIGDGKKFMITPDWAGRHSLMEAVTMLNNGKTISDINKWLKTMKDKK